MFTDVFFGLDTGVHRETIEMFYCFLLFTEVHKYCIFLQKPVF